MLVLDLIGCSHSRHRDHAGCSSIGYFAGPSPFPSNVAIDGRTNQNETVDVKPTAQIMNVSKHGLSELNRFRVFAFFFLFVFVLL